MQIRTYNTLAIALATLLAAPLAMAQDDVNQNATARQPMSPLNSDMSQATFTHLDKNRDGRISIDEARADSSFKSRFAAMDSDHNGYVSSRELGASSKTSGKASTTTMGNADWSSDASGSGTSDANSTGTTSSSTSGQDSSTSDPQSDDGTSTPPKP